MFPGFLLSSFYAIGEVTAWLHGTIVTVMVFCRMSYRRLLASFLLISVSGALWAQMAPNAPVKDFRFPRFGDEGFTQWVLRGEQGIFDKDEQIRVQGMALRVYSGDERMALELSMDSPHATLRLKENRAYSESPIEIIGANFKISGTGWVWSGETKEIVVKKDTVVQFNQGIAGAFINADELESDFSQTEIRSEHLLLRTTEDEYHFEFMGDIRAVSEQMHLSSEQLIALLDVPEGRKEGVNTTAPSELESIRKIVAKEEVVIVQAGKTVRADHAEFYPREKAANLDGSAIIETAGAYVSGETIRSRAGEIVIAGTEAAGRAQMILTETGGLGIQGVSALSSETIVLADTITMRETALENHFHFHGSVEVMSGEVQMQSQEMTTVARRSDVAEETSVESSDIQVGEVKYMVATGGVRIEQNGQIATGEKVTFYPAEEKAVLIGDPKVTNGQAVASGQTMELKPKLAIIRGDVSQSVIVRLPEMPDLGYEAYTPTAATEPRPKSDVKPEATVVTSRVLHMVEKPAETVFRFSEEVEVTGTNLAATCERLDVIAREAANENSGVEMPLELQQIEALDTVVIEQSGRIATADRALITPREGKVVLEGRAVVKDEQGRVAGHRVTLYQGQRRAVVEGGGAEGERARVTLPALLPSSE